MNLQSLFNHAHWLSPLVWTLVHSLWISGAIAIALTIYLAVKPNLTAQRRYTIALSGLILSIVLCLGVFCYLYMQVQRHAAQYTLLEITTFLELTKEFNTQAFKPNNIIDAYTLEIFLFWFVGAAVCLMRYIGAWLICKRLIANSTAITDPSLLDLFARVQKQLQLTRTAALRICSQIDSPCVLGHIKPVVLLPTAMLTHVSTADLEAILAHELAHIFRNDYLIGLCQGIVKSVFFFNPFMHWMDKIICRERENCCDDKAISISGSTVNYAKVLEKVAQSTAYTELSMGLNNQRKHNEKELYMRIERLFINRQKLNFNWSVVASAAFCLTLTFFSSLTTASAYEELSSELRKSNTVNIGNLSLEETNNYLLDTIVSLHRTRHPITGLPYQESTIYKNLDKSSKQRLNKLILRYLAIYNNKVFQPAEDYSHYPKEDIETISEILFEGIYGSAIKAGSAHTVYEHTNNNTPMFRLESFETGQRYQLTLSPEFVSHLSTETTLVEHEGITDTIEWKIDDDKFLLRFYRSSVESNTGNIPISQQVLNENCPTSCNSDINNGSENKLGYAIRTDERIIEIELEIKQFSTIDKNIAEHRLYGGYHLSPEHGLKMVIDGDDIHGRARAIWEIKSKHKNTTIIESQAQQRYELYAQQYPNLLPIEHLLKAERELANWLGKKSTSDAAISLKIAAMKESAVEFIESDKYSEEDKKRASYSLSFNRHGKNTVQYWPADALLTGEVPFELLAKGITATEIAQNLILHCPEFKPKQQFNDSNIKVNVFLKNMTCNKANDLQNEIIALSLL